MLAARAGRDIETACDAETLRGHDAAYRAAYADALMTAVRQSRSPTLTSGFALNKRQFKQRLAALWNAAPKHRGRALLASLAEDGPLAVLAASQQRLAVVLWRHALLGGLTPGQDGLHLQGLLRLKAHPQRCFALRARDQFDSLILRVLHFEDDATIGAFYALYFHSRLFRYIACQYQRRPRRPRRGWGRRSPSRDPRSRKPVGGWDPSCPRRWPY